MLPYGTSTNTPRIPLLTASPLCVVGQRMYGLVAGFGGERLSLFFGREHAWLLDEHFL